MAGTPGKFHDFLTRRWEQARGSLVEELQAVNEAIRILQNGTDAASVDRVQVLDTTGTQNDFKLSDDAEVLLVTTASMIITGFSNVWDGRAITLVYSGSGSCKLNHESSSSIINFRIVCASTNGLTVGTHGALSLVYDAASARWRAHTISAGTPLTPTFAAGDYTAASGNWTVDSGDVTKFTYAQVNKHVLLDFNLVTTTVSATPTDLRRALPSGFTVSKDSYNACLANNNGTKALGIVFVEAATDLMKFYSSGALGAWAAATNASGISGQITIEVD